MKYSAVIFDMDGLLLDSERLAYQACKQACEQFFVNLSFDVYSRCIGTNSKQTQAILSAGHAADTPWDDIVRAWNEIYHKLAYEQPVPVKAGVPELLADLRRNNIPIAVATSTYYENALLKLDKAGLLSNFEFVIGGDQVTNSKPDPEIYLKAVAKIERQPRACLALEDSDHGVTAAHQAGLDVIQIPDMAQPSSEVVAFGHRVVESMFDVATSIGLR